MFNNVFIKSLRYIWATGIVIVLSCLSPDAYSQDEYWYQKSSLYEILPIDNNDIVFLGNSITDGGEFSELFNNINVKNRGIRGDVINGVEKRLDPILVGNPQKIFLLIGINDISHNLSVKELTSRYRRLVEKIRKESPQTKLYIQTVMPINNTFGRYRNLKEKEKTIIDFNKQLKDIASENDAVFIDLTSILSDKAGRLRKDFTNDGLHLTGLGYKAWTDYLKQFIDDNYNNAITNQTK